MKSRVVGAPRVPTLALVLITAALIGGNYVALKEALRYAQPISLTAARVVLGGLSLLGFALLRGERLPRRARDLAGIAVVSLCISTASSLLLALGTRRVTAGVAALTTSTMPLFAALLAIPALKEVPKRLGTLGLVIGVLGAAVLASPALTGHTSGTGIALLLGATFTWACGVVVQKWWNLTAVSPVMLVAVQLLFSALTMTVLALIFEGTHGLHAARGLVLPLFYASVPAMAIPFALLATVLRRAPAIQGAAVAYLIPLFGVLASRVIRGEHIDPIQLVGGVIVLVGVMAVNAGRATVVAASLAQSTEGKELASGGRVNRSS